MQRRRREKPRFVPCRCFATFVKSMDDCLRGYCCESLRPVTEFRAVVPAPIPCRSFARPGLSAVPAVGPSLIRQAGWGCASPAVPGVRPTDGLHGAGWRRASETGGDFVGAPPRAGPGGPEDCCTVAAAAPDRRPQAAVFHYRPRSVRRSAAARVAASACPWSP